MANVFDQFDGADYGTLERQYGLPDGLLSAIRSAEASGTNAVSPKGAVGQFQFMPDTAKAYGLTDPTDPQASAVAAAKYMADAMKRYNTSDPRVLMAEYNGGSAAAKAVLAGNAPAARETQNYIANPPNGANVFDQFDGPASANAKPAQSNTRPSEPYVFGTLPGAHHDTPPILSADVGMGARQVLDAAAQMAAHGLVSVTSPDSSIGQWAREQMQNTEAVNQAAMDDYSAKYTPAQRPASAIGRAAGQMLTAAPLAGVGGPATGLVSAALKGAATGGVANALTPVYGGSDFWQQKLGQAEQGAAIGAGTGGLGNVVGRIFSPNSRTAVQELTSAGVSPTIGQTLGGAVKALEDKATSIPILGDAIKSGQARALDQFNNAIYNRILAPIGETYNGSVGQQALGAIRDKLSNAYETTLAKMGPTPLSDAFNTGVDAIRGMLASRPDALKAFDNVVNAEVWPRFTSANTLTPSALKEADSALGSAARDYFARGNADQLKAAQAITEVQRGLRQMAADANPTQAPVLRAVDSGFAQLVQLQNAAKSVKVARNEGVVTPADYLRGIKSGDVSARDNVFSSGQALNQDFAQAADKVLSSTYPDSGTAGRGLVAAALSGAFAPKLLAGAGIGALPYLPYAQGAVSTLLSRRPELAGLFGTAIKTGAPYLGAAAPLGLLGYQ